MKNESPATIQKNVTNSNNATGVESILLDSPSNSELRVSFDFKPKVKLISSIANSKKIKKFEIKDKSIILDKRMLGIIKQKAKKYFTLIPSNNNIILKYKRREDMDCDLRSLGLKAKSYVENKLIVHNFSFKENEESIKEFFSQFGEIEKVVLEKNSKGFCTGKGVITFINHMNVTDSKLYELRLNGRLLRIEKIKKQVMNTTRLFISHMKKNLKISDLRSILKASGFIPKNIKIDLNEGRNRGYGFVEFDIPQEAEEFMKNYDLVREQIGEGSFVQFSQEKKTGIRR